MRERRLKVSGTYPHRLRGWGTLRPATREVPSLRLAGACLAAAGFKVGGEVLVEVERGRLVVKAVLPAAGERGKPGLGGE